jgi:hypothetical protein
MSVCRPIEHITTYGPNGSSPPSGSPKKGGRGIRSRSWRGSSRGLRGRLCSVAEEGPAVLKIAVHMSIMGKNDMCVRRALTSIVTPHNQAYSSRGSTSAIC